jgi:hypothetical protein
MAKPIRLPTKALATVGHPRESLSTLLKAMSLSNGGDPFFPLTTRNKPLTTRMQRLEPLLFFC